MLSHEEGAPVSSGVVQDEGHADDPARQLIQLIRRGQSFSGRERNCVFLNTHGTRFANVSFVSGLGFADDARAVGQVDWDRDGDLDFWISNRNAPQVRFLRNRIGNNFGSIALRLEGRQSNRDAVGARVIVSLANAAKKPLVRTLRAGDGYMSQSTKWVHLGVGDAESCSVEVHWPSGAVSTYANLATNQRYHCVEGSDEAVLVETPRPKGQLTPQPFKLPTSEPAYSVFSLVRPSIPRLEYLDDQGTVKDLSQHQGSPLLISLWATWCRPCIQELSDLAQHKETFERNDVQVLALCVDRLSSEAKAKPEDATAILRELSFPFHSGEATESLIEQLELLNNYLFGLEKPFPVPTSFLINKNLRLAAIYRGRIDMDRLKEDLAHLSDSPSERRTRSVPFVGRWAGELDTLPMAGFVLELIRNEYLDEASELVQRIQGVFDKRTILDLVVRLGVANYQLGRSERADLHFRMARKIQPNTVGPEIELGQWHESRGEFKEARDFYSSAIQRNPRSLPAMNNLAWLLATCSDDNVRNGEQALRLATRAARIAGGHPGILDTLAASLAEVGRFDEAVRVADRAIQLAQQSSKFNLAAEIEGRREQFQGGQPVR